MIFKLQTQKLSNSDWLWMLLLLIVDLSKLCLVLFFLGSKNGFLFDLAVSTASFLLVTSSFTVRLINLKFSVFFLVTGAAYGLEGGTALSYMPLLVFLLFHFIRLIFIKKYNREFFPPVIYRGYFLVTNVDEGIDSIQREDIGYAKVILYVGLIIWFVCIRASVTGV